MEKNDCHHHYESLEQWIEVAKIMIAETLASASR